MNKPLNILQNIDMNRSVAEVEEKSHFENMAFKICTETDEYC